jgi:2-polyprenyl-3-methyl-5-hydroxy-6-metoxy-1,4-benzoquinol methylase
MRIASSIGCDNGTLCCELANRGYDVVGCEPNAESLQFAQRTAPELILHNLDVDDDPSAIGNQSFDVATAKEVIEHFVRPRNLSQFAKRLLRPGGHLIINTPFHSYLKNLVLALINK